MQICTKVWRIYWNLEAIIKSKCMIERSVGTERIERILLQTYRKLKHEARTLMAFATWKRDERKKQVPTLMNPQKMWQTWSLSDLAGEPNTSNCRPLVNTLRSKPYWGFQGGWSSCHWRRMRTLQRELMESRKWGVPTNRLGMIYARARR